MYIAQQCMITSKKKFKKAHYISTAIHFSRKKRHGYQLDIYPPDPYLIYLYKIYVHLCVCILHK